MTVNELEGASQLVSVNTKCYTQEFSTTSTYYSASAGLLKMDFKGNVDTAEVHAKAYGFLVSASYGKQYVWDSGLVLNGGVGFSYTSFEMNGDVEDNNRTDRIHTESQGVLPFLDLAIGYQF